VPSGVVVYAVGDLHGRLDLFKCMMEKIARDPLRGAMTKTVILLGDYIDRGPHSAALIEHILIANTIEYWKIISLKGNHEDALLNFLVDPGLGRSWCDKGGAQTLSSYGVAPPRMKADISGWIKARDDLIEKMPEAHIRFFRNLLPYTEIGDYFFVHAGVRPGVPLSNQTEDDMLWIRRDFLDFKGRWSKIIVHGHTPSEKAVFESGRIALDTGAYATGVLTALRLQDERRSILQVIAKNENDG
jgi:serine/threonine protein phosphatase 1